MFKIIFSSKIFSFLKTAEQDWREKVVEHTTPTGQHNHVKVKSLPPEEQEKYRPAQEKSKGFDMTIDEVRDGIKKFRSLPDGPARERIFAKLYKNFTPMIMSSVRDRVKMMNPSREDLEDMKNQGALIFTKLVGNPSVKTRSKGKSEDDLDDDDYTGVVDPDSPGMVAYLKKNIDNQLLSYSRKILEGDVKKNKPEILLQIAAKKFLKTHKRHPGELSHDDYKNMARWINHHDRYNDDPDHAKYKSPSDEDIKNAPDHDQEFLKFFKEHPKSFMTRVNNATAEKVQNILSQGVDSLDKNVGDGEDARSLHDILDADQGSFDSPEVHAQYSEINDAIKKMDPSDQEILKLTGEGYKPSEISEMTGLHTKKVLRQLNKLREELASFHDEKNASFYRYVKIAREINKFAKIVFVPSNTIKTANEVVFDNTFRIKKYSSQFVCNCGQCGCLHREAAKKLFMQ